MTNDRPQSPVPLRLREKAQALLHPAMALRPQLRWLARVALQGKERKRGGRQSSNWITAGPRQLQTMDSAIYTRFSEPGLEHDNG